MEQIASFKVNHDKLEPGFYLSRKDEFWDIVSKQRNPVYIYTYDLRVCKPNSPFTLTLLQLHSVEHLVATAFRELYPKCSVYFGPMGCATGFYLVASKQMHKFEIIDIFKHTLSYTEMPGQSSIECGNYRCLNLDAGKEIIKYYLNILEDMSCPLEYPE